MIRSGLRRGFVAVSIGIVLGLGGLAGQPAMAAPSGPNSEGGYSEGRSCGDCYDQDRRCSNRCGDEATRRDCDRSGGGCPDCYDRQPRRGDCERRSGGCSGCYDRQSGGGECDRRGDRDGDDKGSYDKDASDKDGYDKGDSDKGESDKDGYGKGGSGKDGSDKDDSDRKEERPSSLRDVLRKVFD